MGPLILGGGIFLVRRKDITVNLTSTELFEGADAGVQRQVENLTLGRKPAHGAGDRNDWQIHIEGACKERALAKHLGLPFKGKGVIGEPDVGDIHDVRSTEYDNGHLIIYDSDPDERMFWLVTGRNGQYKIHGWILCKDAKQEKFWNPTARDPSFWVPQHALNSGYPANTVMT